MHIISQCMKFLCEPDGDDTNLFLMEIFHSIQNSLYFEVWINNFPFFSWNRHWMTRNCRGEVLLHTVTQIKSIRRNFFDFYSPFWVYIKSKNMDHKLSALRIRFHKKLWMEVIDLNFKRYTFWNQYGSLCG